MTWLIVLIILTYCFTIELSSKYKKQIEKLKKTYKKTNEDLKAENKKLRNRIKLLKGDI